jgi:hypothetical protein
MASNSTADSKVQPLSHIEQARVCVKCTFCTKIIKQFYVQCARCSNLFLCADCFTAGVIIPPHDNSHPYFIPYCMDKNMFSSDWSIKEELLLLDGKL